MVSGRRSLIFLVTFPVKPPAEAATPTPAAAKTRETAPTAVTDTTVAAAAFCRGGTHTPVVKLEASCEGEGEEVKDEIGVGVKDGEIVGDDDAEGASVG
jgi:hypothetical protein